MRNYVFVALVAISFFGGCASKEQSVLEKSILTPETVEIYDVSAEYALKDVNNGRKLLKDFPFIANKPIVDFNGKFSNQFYDKIDYRYKFSHIKDVDFWKLRVNPYIEDFVYVLPTWANEFKRVSNDLFTNLGFTYNLSSKEQEILKWWIGEGGILWVEGGIYSTRYDTFKKNGEINHEAIVKNIVDKSKELKFFDRDVKTYMTVGNKVDYINYEPVKISFETTSNIEYFSDIQNLDIVTSDFMSADFMPNGMTLLATKNNEPLVSFVQYGKGGVVFLRPFEFKDKMYDGELLRWKLMFYLMNRMYNEQPKEALNEVIVVESEAVVEEKVITLHNLNFEYKSYELKKDSVQNLNPIVEYWKAKPSTKLSVVGHTDNIGSNSYNDNLSSQRADSVKKELVKMGIPADLITTKGLGESNPIATNLTDNGRALNRRVEFIIKQR